MKHHALPLGALLAVCMWAVSSEGGGLLGGGFLAQAEHSLGSLYHIAEHRHMREQIEVLEHHPDLCPPGARLLNTRLVELAPFDAITHEMPVDL